jgi:hypothetical protein
MQYLCDEGHGRETVAEFELVYKLAFEEGLQAPNAHIDKLEAELQAADWFKKDALDLLEAAYISGHHEGWEPGPSTDDTMRRLLDFLENHGRTFALADEDE